MSYNVMRFGGITRQAFLAIKNDLQSMGARVPEISVGRITALLGLAAADYHWDGVDILELQVVSLPPLISIASASAKIVEFIARHGGSFVGNV